MLSLWFWLQHWFTDVPGYWTLAVRVVVTAVVSIVALFLTGAALGWDGDTFATFATVIWYGSFVWLGLVGRRFFVRRRTELDRKPGDRSENR